MRLAPTTAALLAVVGVLVACAGAGPDRRTALRVAYYEDARSPETRIVWTLRCDPVGGTLPRRTTACRALAHSGVSTLRPVPPDRACTEIYGGPMVAIVTGTIGGRRVWARLRRDDGCQIDRWKRNWFLVPSGRTR